MPRTPWPCRGGDRICGGLGIATPAVFATLKENQRPVMMGLMFLTYALPSMMK